MFKRQIFCLRNCVHVTVDRGGLSTTLLTSWLPKGGNYISLAPLYFLPTSLALQSKQKLRRIGTGTTWKVNIDIYHFFKMQKQAKGMLFEMLLSFPTCQRLNLNCRSFLSCLIVIIVSNHLAIQKYLQLFHFQDLGMNVLFCPSILYQNHKILKTSRTFCVPM